ncbi:MAG: SLBB domain-containing protein, partial [bacterium]
MERSLTRTHKIILVFFVVLMLAGGLIRLYQAGIIGSASKKKDININYKEPAPVRVHVKGAVLKPDVYSLKPGSRWIDAVEAAGGFTAYADKSALNLADFIRDGQEIYIPEISKTNDLTENKSG